MEKITVYTDTTCFPNPGKGGWGWTTLQGEFDSGASNYTTNQIMELTAVIKAVIKGATVWHKSWLKNDWKNSRNQPVANQELWK